MTTWRRACTNSGNCVEVARDGVWFIVRDSDSPNGPFLMFDLDEWRDFIAGVKRGQFDPPPSSGYETDAEEPPKPGDRGTCSVCAGEIEYFQAEHSWWDHLRKPAENHAAQLGGPA